MLRKRSRSQQRDQHMGNLMMPDTISESYFHSDISNQKPRIKSLFNVPGPFVGFNPRSSESDSVRSPTSPLDFKIFSSFGNPFRCPRSQNDGCQKSWACSKVGLSIIDSLGDDATESGKVPQSLDNKSILLGRQMSITSPNFVSRVNSLENPKSQPKNVTAIPNTRPKPANVEKSNSGVVFEIGESAFEQESCEVFRARSLDSGRYGSHLTRFGNRKSRLGSGLYGNLVPQSTMNFMPTEPGLVGSNLKLGSSPGGSLIPVSVHSDTGFIGSIPASEIELSEDYTCVRTHGPSSKVTHIFCDCVLECHNDEVSNFSEETEDYRANNEAVGPSNVLVPFPPNDFLKSCYSCQKKLDGEDIYMYRGERAFCSPDCRFHEIEIDEEIEKTNNDSSGTSDKPNSSQICSQRSLFTTA